MSKILICGAKDYGYGPIATLLAVAKPLRSLGYELILLGTGSTLGLADHTYFDRVIECDISQIERFTDKAVSFGNVCGVVSVLEAAFGTFAQQMSLPCFYIDSLIWMWSQPDRRVTNADIYFIQRFPGVETKIAEWLHSMRNPQIVGPIVEISNDLLVSRGREPRAIINFGGLETRLVGIDRGLIYPYILTTILMSVLQNIVPPYQEIVFTGNQRVMQQLDQMFPKRPANVSFTQLPHHEFLQLLTSSSYLITSPGLTTTYEAFVSEVPVRFLPPQSYSQSLTLDYFRQEALCDISLHWRDIYSDYAIIPGMQGRAAVKEILSVIDRFSRDLQAQEQATVIFKRMLSEPISIDFTLRQFQFIKSMGKLAAIEIVTAIDNWLCRR